MTVSVSRHPEVTQRQLIPEVPIKATVISTMAPDEASDAHLLTHFTHFCMQVSRTGGVRDVYITPSPVIPLIFISYVSHFFRFFFSPTLIP